MQKSRDPVGDRKEIGLPVAATTTTTTGGRADRPAPAAPSRLWPRIAAGVAGGAVLFLAFPPLGLWYLAPAGVALMTLQVYGVRARRAAWLAYLAGAAFLLPALAWVRPIGYDAWLGLVAVECLFWAAMGAGVAVVTRARAWPVWVACMWVAQEWLRGNLPVLGFPWARLAFSQGESAFTPFAALGGAPLVTFGVALCGGLLALAARAAARAWTERRGRDDAPKGDGTGPRERARGSGPGGAARTAAAALAGVLAVPLAAFAVPRPGDEGRTVRVGIVQGNVPGRGMYFLGDEPAVVLRNHANVTHEMARAVREGRLPKPDLVIWPENSTDIDPYRSAFARDTIHAAVRDIGVPVLVGAVVYTPDRRNRYTRSLVWDPETGAGAYYDKQKLVLFGEYIPFRDVLTKFIGRLRLSGVSALPGDRDGDLVMGPVTIGAVNCYEVAFDSVVRGTVRAGGTPLAVQTNNATYALSNLPAQQLAMSQVRAVEHNRAVVTAATTGISAFVGPDGRVRWRTDELVPDMTVVEVPVRTEPTIATRLGAWPEWILIVVGMGVLGAVVLRQRRTNRARREQTMTGGTDVAQSALAGTGDR